MSSTPDHLVGNMDVLFSDRVVSLRRMGRQPLHRGLGSLPFEEDGINGCLLGARGTIESVGRSAITSLKTCSGLVRSRSCCWPRSISWRPAGSSSLTTIAVE